MFLPRVFAEVAIGLAHGVGLVFIGTPRAETRAGRNLAIPAHPQSRAREVIVRIQERAGLPGAGSLSLAEDRAGARAVA